MNKKVKLSKSDFDRLLSIAECDRMTTKEIYITASDDLPQFWFDFDIERQEIVENGGVDLTKKQYEAICDLAIEFIEEEEITLEDQDTSLPPIDYYKEFGLDRSMFF